jgi:hypothetical protein
MDAAYLLDPLLIFDAIADIASVSCAEHRLYEWLLKDHWRKVLDAVSVVEGLAIEMLPGSQLAVHWTGDTTTARRLVLVCHTDRDGYILHNEARRHDGGLLVAAERPHPLDLPRRPAEFARRHQEIAVVCGHGDAEVRVPATIAYVNSDVMGKKCDGAVVVRVDGLAADQGSALQELLKLPKGTVTAHHVFNVTERRQARPERILAWGLDNGAGVAVSTSVITQLVHSREPLNASVIYTTGEKYGFTGLLEHIFRDAKRIAENKEVVAWIVVDSSDAGRARLLGLDQWRRTRLTPDGHGIRDISLEADVLPSIGLRCTTKTGVIRLEDLVSVFDLSAARMLYQAALHVRGQLLTTLEKLDPVQADLPPPGASGVLVGGRCEATVLTHLNDLLELLGLPQRPQDSVASLAIPVRNWRLLNRDQITTTIQPEETHARALDTARDILLAACRLHRSYDYPPASPSGFRLHAGLSDVFGEAQTPKSRDAYVRLLLRRMKQHTGRRSAHERWVSEEGQALVEAMMTPDWRKLLKGPFEAATEE